MDYCIKSRIEEDSFLFKNFGGCISHMGCFYTKYEGKYLYPHYKSSYYLRHHIYNILWRNVVTSNIDRFYLKKAVKKS